MKTNELRCDDIQQDIAVGQQLSDTQLAHINECDQCAALHQEMMRLDNLVKHTVSDRVPDDFADRVMEQLPEQPGLHSTDSVTGQRLLVMFSQSRLLQTLLLGLGVAVGVSHVVRFFLGIFITTLAAAF